LIRSQVLYSIELQGHFIRGDKYTAKIKICIIAESL
jgi:hypothetical protein